MASLFKAPQFDVGNGITPEDGLQLFFFVEGTSTPRDTFTTEALDIENSNPVISDANGVFPEIWMAESSRYKVRLEDKGDVLAGFGVVEVYIAGVTTNPDIISNSALIRTNPDTLAIAVADTLIIEGDALNIQERTTGNGGGAFWDVVLASSVTTNTFGIVACTGVPLLALVLRLQDGVRYASQFGAADGIADSFGAIDAAIRSLPEGGDVYMPGGDLNLGINTLRDDVLDPTEVGKTITLIGNGASEDQANSGKITTLHVSAGNAHIIFDGNRSGGRDFSVRGAGGSLQTLTANIIVESSRAQWKNIVSSHSNGSGLRFRFGNNSSFENISCISNAYRGFEADGTGYVNKQGASRPNDLNASVFINIDVRANGDIGLYTGINSGFSNFYYNITTQGNGGVGLQFNSDFNRVFGFYGEANGGDLVNATAIVAGSFYVIETVGTTDYTLIGALDNNVGTGFNATGVGVGTGTAAHSVDIEFSSTAANNFVWGAFFNSAASGAQLFEDKSVQQRNYVDSAKMVTTEINLNKIVLGEFTTPPGVIVFDGEGDGVNRSLTLEGTSVTQQIDITSSGAGQLGINPDFITLEASTALAFVNGWGNFGGSRKVGGHYKDKFGIVHLEGVINAGTTTSPTVMFNLPAGSRPGGRIYYTASSGAALVTGFIESSGEVYIESGVNTNLALDGISFRTT